MGHLFTVRVPPGYSRGRSGYSLWIVLLETEDVQHLSHQRPASITLFLFFSLFSQAVFASGQQEGDVLDQAIALTEEKQYNKAISLLVKEAKANPNRLYEIQLQLREIWKVLEKIKGKYASLLGSYESDPQKASALIKELSQLDPYPNERRRKILMDARDIIGFINDRRRWEGIMDAALVQLDQGLYWEAVLTYYGGFDLGREFFDDDDYDKPSIDLVDRRTAEVVELLEEFDRFKQPLRALLAAELEVYHAPKERDVAAYKAVFEPLLENILLLGELFLALEEAAQFFLDYEEPLRLSKGDEREVYHLLYLYFLISGRFESEVKEGISGAVERFWWEILDKLDERTDSLLAESFLKGQEEYHEKNDQASRATFQESQAYSSLHQRSLGAWENRFSKESFDNLSEEDRDILALQLARKASARLKSSVAEEYIELMDNRMAIDALDRRRREIELSAEGRSLRTSLLEEKNQLFSRRDAWENRLADLQISEGAEKADNEGPDLVALAIREIDALLKDSIKAEVALVVAIETIERAPLEVALAALRKNYQDALDYLEGVTITVGEGEMAQEVLAIYPNRALEILGEFPPEIDRIRRTMTAFQERLRTDTTWEDPAIQAVFVEGEAFLASLQALSDDASRFYIRAEDELFQANRFRQEGDRRFQEARQLTDQEEFLVAKERLTIAADLYDRSLSHQEDSDLRRIRDREIPDFFNEIHLKENLRVIQDVRAYLTQGQSLYTKNEFVKANSLFLRAETRWFDTNVEPSSEIVYWLELSRIALSLAVQRELLLTDPLFPEMTQYLNQATADYSQGRRFMTARNEEAANRAFDDAEENLFLVRQFYPFNTEVRTLMIRIAQQRDPEGAEELIRKDFNDAKNKIRFNPGEAYMELKNLEAFAPDYPGLDVAIEEAEYATGIRVRPPDPAKSLRSQELYQQALTIVNSNVRVEFPLAQALLDEAFSLNPDNRDIILLKESVALSVGGTTTTILSSVDQQKYGEAVGEFNNGNYLKAQILVDILLENPDNRYNTRLLELKERIQSAR